MSGTSRFSSVFRHPLFIILTALLVTVGGMFIISHTMTNLPATMTEKIVLTMLVTGMLLTLISYGIYKSNILLQLHSLRWLLLLIVLFTVGVVLLDLWLLARFLFVDTLYFPLVVTMMVFAGLTAVSFGYFASRAMIVRLLQLAEAASEVAQGNFETRLDIRGKDEIAYLLKRFNEMASDLQAVDEQKKHLEQTRRDLIAWVSHDLRTPLTSMRVMIEALADGVIVDEATQSRYLQTSLAEISHLSHLIDDLFELAQLDVRYLQLDYCDTPIRELVSDTIGSMIEKAKRKNITLSGTVESNIDLIQMAPDKIQRVLKNLVDNAIKYTPEHEAISIHVRRVDADLIEVDVHNTGVLIPEESLPNVFKSFYRGEKSRAQTDAGRGTGLGLAIAQGFIQAHGGKIWAMSTPEDGTTFRFIIPERQN